MIIAWLDRMMKAVLKTVTKAMVQAQVRSRPSRRT